MMRFRNALIALIIVNRFWNLLKNTFSIMRVRKAQSLKVLMYITKPNCMQVRILGAQTHMNTIDLLFILIVSNL